MRGNPLWGRTKRGTERAYQSAAEPIAAPPHFLRPGFSGRASGSSQANVRYPRDSGLCFASRPEAAATPSRHGGRARPP